jgi:hypothetical protein
MRSINLSGRLARLPTNESARFRQDEKDREKHVKGTVGALKVLLPFLKPFADVAHAEYPGKDETSISRRGRAFMKSVKADSRANEFLDTWVGREEQQGEAASWRNSTLYAIRDHLVYRETFAATAEKVSVQAFKGYQAIAMSGAQAPLKAVVPEAILAFLPKNIIVEVDPSGEIHSITDRFENEHLTLGKKIARMHLLVSRYNAIARKVKADLRSGDEITRLAALVTAIIMETGIRPGKEGNAAFKTVGGEKVEVETFGAITLGPNHVKFMRENFAQLEFVGKKGSINTASLSDAAILKALDEYTQRALTTGSKYIFVTKAGVPFDYTDLQRYFREHFDGLAPTDFRKLKATEEMLTAIRAEQGALYARIRAFAKDKKIDLKARVTEEIVKTLEAAIARAQMALSHDSASTTRESYINPEVIFRFLSTGQVEGSLQEAILDGEKVLAFDPQTFLARALKAASYRRATTLGDLLDELHDELGEGGGGAPSPARVARRLLRSSGPK